MIYYSLHELNVEKERVLLRVDYNVPMSEDGSIADDRRIRESMATIKYLLAQNASIVIMSHLGNPRGNRDEHLSLYPISEHLSQLLERPVIMAPDCTGSDTSRLVSNLKDGEILMLENLRFNPGEQDPDQHPEFIDKLASYGSAYVNDAFGTAHRSHASTSALAKYFEGKASVGFLIEKEIAIFDSLLKQPSEPFHAIIGGKKIDTKIGLLFALLDKVQALYIGGAMAFTFLKAQGFEVGNSLVDENNIETALKVIKACEKRGIDLNLPVDIVAANQISKNATIRNVPVSEGIAHDFMGADIGPDTILNWCTKLKEARCIFWNGPVGIFELEPFKKGTTAIAKALCDAQNTTTIIGGGDSSAAIYECGFEKKVSHISTGGGASLQYIENGTLSALEDLRKESES
jgi:phosphoglycerate kinase